MTTTWFHSISVSPGKALVFGIILNLLFVVVEFIVGILVNSLALISDAGHNLSDVASLALALVAFNLTKVRPSQLFTYGLGKSTVFIAWINAVVLFIVIGAIGWESIGRFRSTEVVQGYSVAVVAGVGIVINSVTAMLFFKERKKDLNLRGAFLHMAADTLVSFGVVCTGLLITFTQWYWADTVMSLVIVGVILISGWGLLRDSTVLVLDGVPRGIDLKRIRNVMMNPDKVTNVHHIHIWAMSTSENALTAHITVAGDAGFPEIESIKNRIRSELAGLSIHHVTLEFEREDASCTADDC